MSFFDTLDQRIQILFEQHNTVYEAHRNAPSLPWCLTEPTPYPASYYRLDTYGSHPLKRLVNRVAGGILAPIRDGYIQSVISTVKSRYFLPLIAMGHSISDRELTLFLERLENHLFTHWIYYRRWHFAELFSFINTLCLEACTFFKLPNDPYQIIKQEHNNRYLGIYTQIREDHLESLSFQALLYLVLRANWLDCYLEQTRINQFIDSFSVEINDVLDQASWIDEFMLNHPYIDYSELLTCFKENSKHILYELDNHGEILFDLLFIEQWLKQGHHVCISTKQQPILNDVTYDDLKSLLQNPELNHLNDYLKTKQLTFIGNGSNDVIALRYQMSTEYIQAYTRADYVILKGQGNFESYPLLDQGIFKSLPIHYKTPHFYLLGIKSDLTRRSVALIHPKILVDSVLALSNQRIN